MVVPPITVPYDSIPMIFLIPDKNARKKTLKDLNDHLQTFRTLCAKIADLSGERAAADKFLQDLDALDKNLSPAQYNNALAGFMHAYGDAVSGDLQAFLAQPQLQSRQVPVHCRGIPEHQRPGARLRPRRPGRRPRGRRRRPADLRLRLDPLRRGRHHQQPLARPPVPVPAGAGAEFPRVQRRPLLQRLDPHHRGHPRRPHVLPWRWVDQEAPAFTFELPPGNPSWTSRPC